MPDVIIYDKLHKDGAYAGEQLERAMGRLEEVQWEMNQVAKRMERKATAILGAHRDEGDSKITVTQGRVDTYINLDDSAGDHAARLIERGNGRSEGIFALASAMLAARG